MFFLETPVVLGLSGGCAISGLGSVSGQDGDGVILAGSSRQGGAEGLGFLVSGVVRGWWGGVQAPLGLEGLLDLLGAGELEVAHLPGDGGALVGGLELGHELGLELARLLGVEVAHLLGHVDEGGDGLVVALLGALLGHTAGAADLHGQLLALGVADEFACQIRNMITLFTQPLVINCLVFIGRFSQQKSRISAF